MELWVSPKVCESSWFAENIAGVIYVAKSKGMAKPPQSSVKGGKQLNTMRLFTCRSESGVIAETRRLKQAWVFEIARPTLEAHDYREALWSKWDNAAAIPSRPC